MNHSTSNSSDMMKGRGAQMNTNNPYLGSHVVQEHWEALDEPLLSNSQTQFIPERPKKIINKVTSPDIPLPYSMNPYQGCEHGCVYCYARNTHHYWGFSAGLDFERKIIVKENAADLLAATLRKKNWKPEPIMLSGNTDCYQPVERKLGITRRMLEVLWDFRHPVGIITKNSLILRDLDLLKKMASENLVRVSISITTLNEEVRKSMEPRTATSRQRLRAVEALSLAGIPVNVMIAPIIPGLTDHEIPAIMKAAGECGATSAAYTMVRLNGAVGEVFADWIRRAFPDRAEKVLSHISAVHGGKVSDSRFGKRMRGQGKQAAAIRSLFALAKEKYIKGNAPQPYNLQAFAPPRTDGQLSLFGR